MDPNRELVERLAALEAENSQLREQAVRLRATLAAAERAAAEAGITLLGVPDGKPDVAAYDHHAPWTPPRG